ncbi:uncharacterized protein LOC129348135 [Amphiprion ocellaris]|uniref:uncharacterized protein LOC129348135 n=1 Tax=Amphiprion ocellaris TaxID=80972 RepID=UPI002410E1B2|nr:uncharacterized protein LOC129348135 [Amphiprion ocellaris]
METYSSSLESIREAAMLRSGVVGDPYLAGGYLIGSSLLGLLIIIAAFWYNRRNLSLFKRACAMSSSCQDYCIMSIQVIFNTLVSLLINDALKLIVAITFGATLVASSCDVIRCDIVEMTWFLSRWFAMNIHLVNASLCIYNLRQPLSVIRFRSIEILIGVLNGIIVPTLSVCHQSGHIHFGRFHVSACSVRHCNIYSTYFVPVHFHPEEN